MWCVLNCPPVLLPNTDQAELVGQQRGPSGQAQVPAPFGAYAALSLLDRLVCWPSFARPCHPRADPRAGPPWAPAHPCHPWTGPRAGPPCVPAHPCHLWPGPSAGPPERCSVHGALVARRTLALPVVPGSPEPRQSCAASRSFCLGSGCRCFPGPSFSPPDSAQLCSLPDSLCVCSASVILLALGS